MYTRNVVDRVVTTGTVFMGLTMDCTRCHNHKFDPLTMEDFYSMFAYFNSIDGPAMDGNRKDHKPVIQVPNPEQRQRKGELVEIIAKNELKMNSEWPVVDEAQAAWEDELREAFAPDPDLLTVQNFSADSIEAAYIEADFLEAGFISTESFSAEGFKADRFVGRDVRSSLEAP